MATPTYSTSPAYCTDEDVAVYSPGDIEVLTPRGATIAAGRDGEFDADSPWILTSATVDFEAQGVKPSMLVVLEGGKVVGTDAQLIAGSGGQFAVGSVAGKFLTLRRIGFPDAVGQPPGGTAGATSVGFRACSLSPQIGQASDEINRRYGVDAAQIYRGPDYLADVKALELATILTVLTRQYTVNNRVGDGDFAMKMKQLGKELDAVLHRIQLRWKPPADAAPPASIFRMRINRG